MASLKLSCIKPFGLEKSDSQNEQDRTAAGRYHTDGYHLKLDFLYIKNK